MKIGLKSFISRSGSWFYIYRYEKGVVGRPLRDYFKVFILLIIVEQWVKCGPAVFRKPMSNKLKKSSKKWIHRF